MKKLIALFLLIMFASFVWDSLSPGDLNFQWDGDDDNGPFAALIGGLFAGGGLLIAGLVLVGVALLLAFVFAGLSILFVGGLALAAVVVALAVSPLLLPLMIPVGIIWLLTRRSRRKQAMQQTV